MYSVKSAVESRLNFVFPDKVRVNFTENDSIPKFFTFVGTDGDVEQQYFHTLIYYEKISKEVILHDYNAEIAA